MSETFYVLPIDDHNNLVEKAYIHRGYNEAEAKDAAKFSASTSWHGIRTHNAIKALHLDELFGSVTGGCKPGADIEVRESKFEATQSWNANFKLGQSTAYQAIEACISMADKYGVGVVSVDNAFHYLWGGGYVMEAAKRGYFAYTNCTAALAEVVPFKGKFPTLGTNPHSWGIPTTDAIGFPIVIDWATSVIAMGRVQQFLREGQELPPECAVDENGEMTRDPAKVKSLLPFGAHKGYAMSLLNELMGSMIGCSLPTKRSKHEDDGDKHGCCFYFQVVHPEAMSAGAFAKGRSQSENIKTVVEDILGHGNESCLLPGQIEAEAAKRCDANGGLLFTSAELDALDEIAEECQAEKFDRSSLKEAK